MKTVIIPLTRGKSAIIDAADADLVQRHKWHAVPGRNGTWYAAALITRRGIKTTIQMHRLIMGDPPGVQIDHRDHDGLHNTRANLREATHFQQLANRRLRRDSVSGFKGVGAQPRCSTWRARIMANGKCVDLGGFPTAEDAARAYDKAAMDLHGEFAFLNFPEDASTHELVDAAYETGEQNLPAPVPPI